MSECNEPRIGNGWKGPAFALAGNCSVVLAGILGTKRPLKSQKCSLDTTHYLYD